jgi:hypothetical protein
MTLASPTQSTRATPPQAAVQAAALPSAVREVSRSPGRGLDRESLGFWGSCFRHDFSGVRIHDDALAATAAESVDALAYTVGSHVVFAQGRFAPRTADGDRLLAHELTHVVQQHASAGALPVRVGPIQDDCERESERFASGGLDGRSGDRVARPICGAPAGLLQRFSKGEHLEIAEAAYQAAHPAQTAAAGVPTQEIDKGLVESFKRSPVLAGIRPEDRKGKAATASEVYSVLLTAADEVASLELMEDLDRERRSGIRVPVLSHLWDWIGDKAHYADLAARNIDHFHPHNFKAWQTWHWSGIDEMEQAYRLEVEAAGLKADLQARLASFGRHRDRAREALERGADEAAQAELAQMSRLVSEAKGLAARIEPLRERSAALAVHAIQVSAFGDHFLTDAFAGGHIVTPRVDLLNGFATRFLGLIEVPPPLHCANVPSLAWHDLDNRFGVWVQDRLGSRWKTYGDNYLHGLAPAKEPETMRHVTTATARSVRHMWETAAGRTPSSLTDVLDLLPAPDLDPAIYPAWTPQDWDLQLRYAAGEPIGANYDAMGGGAPSSGPGPEVPNPKGEQLAFGVSLLSFRATCLNVVSAFSYDRFVVPMLDRIRREYHERFYVASEKQIVKRGEAHQAQPSVVGHTVLGSLLGLLGGAAIGFLAGGVLGAVIGGIAGLFAGGVIGGLAGKTREPK